MGKGIKMSECKFYVDEDARTVICVISDTETLTVRDMLLDFIHDNFRFNDLDMEIAINWCLSDKLEMPKSFVGKAVCAEEDEWDEEFGCLLAYTRARNKLYTSFFKRANKFVQVVDARLGDMIAAFNDMGMILEERKQSDEKLIDEWFDDSEEEEEVDEVEQVYDDEDE